MGYMKEEVKRINGSAVPESGARPNARKDSSDELDSRRPGKLPKAETVKQAVVDRSTAQKCRRVQTEGNNVPQFSRGKYTETL